MSDLVPYFDDGQIVLYVGDCREVTEWLAADVLVTDPPYGRGWRSGSGMTNSYGRGRGSVAHGGIAGDDNTATRDEALAKWGGGASPWSSVTRLSHARPGRFRSSATPSQSTPASRGRAPDSAVTSRRSTS